MNAHSSLRIGLAAARNAPSVEERLQAISPIPEGRGRARRGHRLFPEPTLPGLRGQDFFRPAPDQPRQQAALEETRAAARRHGVAVVMGMEWEIRGRAAQRGVRRLA